MIGFLRRLSPGIIVLMAVAPAAAGPSGQIYVTNEKSSTITVLDNKTHKVIRSFKTCKRPRGVHFSKDRTQFYVGCADDNVIVVYETATAKLVKRIRGIEEPETFDLSPDGKTLYVSNEEDATTVFVDVASGKVAATLKGHTKIVNSVAFGPGGNLSRPHGPEFTVDGKKIDFTPGTAPTRGAV